MSPVKALKNSFFELKNLRSLVILAMLLALCVVLGTVANITMFGNAVKLNFTGLPMAIAGALYGPVASLLVGALADIIAIMLVPNGSFFPGITLCAAMTAATYGFFLYKNQITLPRIIGAWVVKALISETFLKAYWLYFMYGGDYFGYWLFWRLIQQAILCVPEILLIFIVGRLAVNAHKRLEVGRLAVNAHKRLEGGYH